MSRLHSACLAALFLLACGGEEAPTSSRGETKDAPSKPAKPGGAAAAPTPAVKGGKGAAGSKQLWTYPKVDDSKYRRAFTSADFEPDLSGEVNRDPFRSYVLEDLTPSTNKATSEVDECERRTVGSAFGLRELTLMGIVKKGTTAYALFSDSSGDGHIAKRGDCLSKDRARIKEIGATNMVVEIRGEAAPGAPAPEPREEEWRLHPAQLDLRQEPIELDAEAPAEPSPNPAGAKSGTGKTGN